MSDQQTNTKTATVVDPSVQEKKDIAVVSEGVKLEQTEKQGKDEKPKEAGEAPKQQQQPKQQGEKNKQQKQQQGEKKQKEKQQKGGKEQQQKGQQQKGQQQKGQGEKQKQPAGKAHTTTAVKKEAPKTSEYVSLFFKHYIYT